METENNLSCVFADFNTPEAARVPFKKWETVNDSRVRWIHDKVRL